MLIQTKTSTSFNSTDIANLFTYAKLYFDEANSIFHTDEMKKFIELKDYIFGKGNKLKKNPELLLYFVTLGTWCNDDNLKSVISVNEKMLKDTNLFSTVEFFPG